MKLRNYNLKNSFFFKFIKSIYYKYNRIIYYIKYDIPFFDSKIDINRFCDYNKILNNISSVSIIGKGASVFHSNPLDIIQNTDFKILMNSVDIEYLENYLGKDFDLQITTHIARANSIIPVFDKRKIKDLKSIEEV